MSNNNSNKSTLSLNSVDSRQEDYPDVEVEQESTCSVVAECTECNIQERKMVPLYLRVPNTAFGIAMGLVSYSLLWKVASEATFVMRHRKGAEVLNYMFWVLAIIIGGILVILYPLKWIFYPKFSRDEWKHPIRLHFNNIPHIVLLMLSIGVPSDIEPGKTALRTMWGISFVAQICVTQSIYHRWLFSLNSTINAARPQYCLSTVGWFLLSVLGQQTNIREATGLNLPTFCFGVGAMFYVMVVFSIFSGLHKARGEVNSPALFMLFAPPSVAAVALDLMDGDPDTFSDGASMLLGWSLVMFILVIKTGISIKQKDRTIGTYWAFVFPISALTSLTIRYAGVENSISSKVMAISFMTLATLMVTIVLVRMGWHQVLVMKGKERWVDPLFERCYCYESSSELEKKLKIDS